MLIPPETIATRIEMVDSPHTFKRNPEIKVKLRKLIKNLNTSLRRKGLPIRVKQKGGIQILVRI